MKTKRELHGDKEVVMKTERELHDDEEVAMKTERDIHGNEEVAMKRGEELRGDKARCGPSGDQEVAMRRGGEMFVFILVFSGLARHMLIYYHNISGSSDFCGFTFV
ncbi:unnamed protein product [Brassica oleracea var. botrytis]|uniref:Uncharacterized protein n=2 Tax=Brassica TaxID=3705 RepID=A0A3P6DTY2_BRAOL|nr:unnamed protein product [Brassica napus]VDD31150.1 unnamed protein product [Brassica oleracea]